MCDLHVPLLSLNNGKHDMWYILLWNFETPCSNQANKVVHWFCPNLQYTAHRPLLSPDSAGKPEKQIDMYVYIILLTCIQYTSEIYIETTCTNICKWPETKPLWNRLSCHLDNNGKSCSSLTQMVINSWTMLKPSWVHLHTCGSPGTYDDS